MENKLSEQAALKRIEKWSSNLFNAAKKGSDGYCEVFTNKIIDKIKEYDLDKKLVLEAQQKAYELLMENKYFEEAEEYAKKFFENKKTNEYIKIEEKEKDEFLTMSIIFTLIFGILYFVISLNISENWILSIIIAIVLSIFHPFIGKICHSLFLEIGEKFDSLFNTNKVENLKKHSSIYMAGWPVVLLKYFFFNGLGIIYGTLFKKSDE